MNPEFPLINGTAYSWASIRIEVLGSAVRGFTAISYGESDKKENNYGAGRFPVSRGYGNVEPNASVSMYKDTVEAIQKIAPNGRIQDIPPFDITVAYKTRAGKFMKEVIRNFEFLENKVETNQGDNKIVVTLPGICSHIDWAK
jgi:hypothetical protein